MFGTQSRVMHEIGGEEMKRGLLIGVGAFGALGAVFAITPPHFGNGVGGASAVPAGKSGAGGTFLGDTAQSHWGPIQVQIHVNKGIILSVDCLHYPLSSGTDQYSNEVAIPLLNGEVKNMSLATAMAEATKYLSGGINPAVGVTGASYISKGYLLSLQGAIRQASL